MLSKSLWEKPLRPKRIWLKIWPVFIALVAIVFIAGCGASKPSDTSAKAVTASFSSAPASIQSGGKATLTWQTSNADSVSIDQGVGGVGDSGSKDVTPSATTTYTLTAMSGGNSVTRSAIVTVTNPPPPTGQFAASPSTIQAGQTATLSWTTTNATAVSIDQGIGPVDASGTKTVSPTQNTTYTLTVTGGGTTVTQTASVTVMNAPPPAPTASLSASTATIQAGQSATLSWNTTNATDVSIDQGIGAVGATGTKKVSPLSTTTYTLTATGNGKTITSPATITVTSAPAPQLTGVLNWKGGTKGIGRYDQETTLTPQNVNPTQFGKVRALQTDGELLPQPLYVRSVDLGASGVHDLLLVATEHDSVYAYDGQGTSTTPLWQRNFLDPAQGVTTQSDDHGGRSTFGGEIGITGTPVVDPATGVLYVVAATESNGVVTDTLHALNIRDGSDASSSVVINASVEISATAPGTGLGEVNGVITFEPAQQNQRPGLVLSNGVLYIAFGSFSDFPPYHGWLFAYDPKNLSRLGVFSLFAKLPCGLRSWERRRFLERRRISLFRRRWQLLHRSC